MLVGTPHSIAAKNRKLSIKPYKETRGSTSEGPFAVLPFSRYLDGIAETGPKSDT